jgi:hypothetical protein
MIGSPKLGMAQLLRTHTSTSAQIGYFVTILNCYYKLEIHSKIATENLLKFQENLEDNKNLIARQIEDFKCYAANESSTTLIAKNEGWTK